MSAVCPACGVPVMPGYVKCPKCHAALPYGTGRRPGTSPIGASGTAVEDRGFPFIAVIVPLAIILVIVVIFAMRGGDKSEPEAEAETAQPVGPTQQQVQQTVQAPLDQTPPPQNAPDPRAAAAELERTLRRARLWSSVEVNGTRIDVRSALCGDAAMTTVLDGAVASLHAVGLTQLRCLADSGAVVSDRGL